MADQRDKLRTSEPFARRKSNETMVSMTDSLVDDGQSLLVPLQNGQMQFGNFVLTGKGLITRRGVTQESWHELGAILIRLDASIQWIIGDWMAFGQRTWGVTYEQVAETTGYDVDTLYNYASVARKVEISLRNEKLSYTHHTIVASLSPEDQQYWLWYAVENDLSAAALRRAILNKPTALSSDRQSKPKPYQRRISLIEREYFKVGQSERDEITQELRALLSRLDTSGGGE